MGKLLVHGNLVWCNATLPIYKQYLMTPSLLVFLIIGRRYPPSPLPSTSPGLAPASSLHCIRCLTLVLMMVLIYQQIPTSSLCRIWCLRWPVHHSHPTTKAHLLLPNCLGKNPGRLGCDRNFALYSVPKKKTCSNSFTITTTSSSSSSFNQGLLYIFHYIILLNPDWITSRRRRRWSWRSMSSS